MKKLVLWDKRKNNIDVCIPQKDLHLDEINELSNIIDELFNIGKFPQIFSYIIVINKEEKEVLFSQQMTSTKQIVSTRRFKDNHYYDTVNFILTNVFSRQLDDELKNKRLDPIVYEFKLRTTSINMQ